MAKIHEGQPVGPAIEEIGQAARTLAGRVRGEWAGDRSVAHDALQESVEAILLDRVVRGGTFPSPRALGIDAEEYLGGLGDLVGEMRRLALSALSEGNVAKARERLAEMESVYRALLRFEGPRAIISLKSKQDTARALLEKTRGDVALAEVLARAGAATAGRAPVKG